MHYLATFSTMINYVDEDHDNDDTPCTLDQHDNDEYKDTDDGDDIDSLR
jgi:hypothetical protein